MPAVLHDLTLTSLAYGGDALGRIPGDAPGTPERVVFVPFGIPGERVRIRIVAEHRGIVRAELVEVLEPSPERIRPRCKHFGVCGGCHYQHMPYPAQLRAKAEILRDQLRRIGHIEDPPVQAAVPSPEPWHYRNQVQLHLTPDGRLGYVKAASLRRSSSSLDPEDSSAPASSILPITECHLPEPAANDLWPQLEFEPSTDVDRVVVRQGRENDLMLVLESHVPELPELNTEAGISVVHAFAGHSVVLAGSDELTIRVLHRDFRFSALAFFQVNTSVAAEMVKHILNNLPHQQGTIIDAYCGVGLFSAFLAPLCERLISIESSPAACEDFAFNLDDFDNVDLYQDAAENVLPVLDATPDLVIVDPPRAGLEPAALDGILRLQPPGIIYVSCNPSTLARDARRLANGGYSLRSSTPFDLFPQTYHIESISWFAR